MNSDKLFILIDLIEDIKKIDEMILLHQKDKSSNLMISQYQAKKVKLTSNFISELISSQSELTNSLLLIKRLLDKFYSDPYMASFTEKEISEFKELESAL